MAIILHGSFSRDNFGDTLLLNIFADYIRTNYPFHEIFASNTSKHASQFCNVNQISKLKALKSQYPIIFCGGGYFGEPPSSITYWSIRMLNRHIICGLNARLQNIPYAVLGVGFGPLTKWWTRYPVLNFLRGASIRAFRDKESVEYLHSYDYRIHCIQVADAILSYSSSDLIRIANSSNVNSAQQEEYETNKKTIILHIPGCNNNDHKIRQFIVEWMVSQVESRNDIELVALMDLRCKKRPDFFDWLSKFNNKKIRIVEFIDPSQLLMEIEQSYGIITTKLHVGICGAVLGKRILSFPLHLKTLRFYNQIGRSDICQPLKNLNQIEAEKFMLNLINGVSKPVLVSESIRQESLKIWHLLDCFLKDLVICEN